MKRFYNFRCISYLPKEKIIKKLNTDKVSHWAIAYHDKDINKETEKPKEPHYHILVIFVSAKSENACRKYFEENEGQHTLVKISEDLEHDYRYLLHKDDKDKYQYTSEALTIDDNKYWTRIDADEKGRTGNDELVDDLMDEILSIEDLGRKYGRDFIKNMSRYLEFRNEVTRERWTKKEREKADRQKANRIAYGIANKEEIIYYNNFIEESIEK